MTTQTSGVQAPALAVSIDRVAIGVARDFTRPGSRSAIDKRAVDGPVRVGPDKAIHHYPRDHYAAWQADLGAHALLETAGAFGENLSSVGLTEAEVCLGDRFALGTAVVEVSQLRQPCWKLSDRFGLRDMARRVQDSGRTGWYYRVLQPDHLQAGDALVLVARPWPEWTLARIIDVLYHQPFDAAVLQALAALPLTPSWQRMVQGRLARAEVEDWRPRLDGPPPQQGASARTA